MFVFQWANDDDVDDDDDRDDDDDDNRFVLCQYAYWNFCVTFFRHETHDNSHIGICTRTISRTCYFLFDILFGSSETILNMKVFFFIFAKAIISQCLILCVCFVDRCLSFCPFFSWPLCCLSFDLLLLTTPLVTFLRKYMTNCRVQIFRWGVISNYEYTMHQYLNVNLLGFIRHTTYACLDMYSFCDVWITCLRISNNVYVKLSFWYRKCKHVEWICLVYIIAE